MPLSPSHGPSRITHDEDVDVYLVRASGLWSRSRYTDKTTHLPNPFADFFDPAEMSEVPTLPPALLTEGDIVTRQTRRPFSSPVTAPVTVAAVSPVPLVDRALQGTRSRLSAAPYSLHPLHS